MKKLSLSTKVFIGFAIGILLGVLLKEKAMIIKPIGDLFLKLIKMIVVPLVACSIISGISGMSDIKKLRRIGGKTLLYYIFTTICAGIIGLIVANVLKPGTGFVVGNIAKGTYEAAVAPSFADTLLQMVPQNPISALADGNLIQIIIFAVFFGIAITLAGEKGKYVRNFFEDATNVMYKLTGIVMEFAPFGVAALIANSIGEYGLKIFGPLGKFILADYIGIVLIVLLIYSIILKFVIKINLKDFFRSAVKIWAVTASTTSSSGTLPVTINVTEKELGVPKEIAGFTLPLGATMNMDGAANYFAIAVIFVAQVYGVPLSITQQITIVLLSTLISVGAPGIPGGGIVMTIMLLTTMGLPLEIMGLIAGIYRIIDMGHTTLNVTGDMVATLYIAKTEDMWDTDKISKNVI